MELFLDMKYLSLYYNLDFLGKLYATFETINYVSLF